MPSDLPRTTVRYSSREEIRLIAKAARILGISMSQLVAEASREVAKKILAEDRRKRLTGPSNQLTLNQ